MMRGVSTSTIYFLTEGLGFLILHSGLICFAPEAPEAFDDVRLLSWFSFSLSRER
jgi:hypothetical protein